MTATAHQGHLLSELARKGLSFHTLKPSAPSLFYPLSSVGGVASNKVLFSLVFQEAESKSGPASAPSTLGKDKKELIDPSKTRIELIEKEAVKKTIGLDHVLSVRQVAASPTTLELIYLSDPPASAKRKDKEGAAGKQRFLLQFGFVSRRDAYDAAWLIHQHTTKTFPGFSFGQICLHKGYVEKQRKSKVSWVRRYLRLFPNRLLCYRTHESPYPVNVFVLSGSGCDGRSKGGKGGPAGRASMSQVAAGPLPEAQLRVDLVRVSGLPDGRCFQFEPTMLAKTLGKKFLFRAESSKEQIQWLLALATEQEPKFDQPIKALQARPHDAAISSLPTRLPIQQAQAPGNTGAASPSAAAAAAAGSEEVVWDPDREAKLTPGELAAAGGKPALLAKMNIEQRLFFSFMSLFRDAKHLHGTDVWTTEEWAKATPQKFFSSRGKSIRAVDERLQRYHLLIAVSNSLLRSSRLVCTEWRSTSAASQIGFSFPGFESAIFDVGRVAVVCPWQLFSGTGSLAFQESDWQGAMSSRCVAKELMQSSPDVTALFEANRPDEAKAVLQQSQTDVLHNIALASYFRAHALAEERRVALQPGDIISWNNVLAHFETRENWELMQTWSPVNYVFNPPLERLQNHFDQLLADVSSSSSSLSVSLDDDPSGGPTDLVSPTAASSPSSNGSPSEGEREQRTRDADKAAKALMQMRVLADPLHLLALLRFLIDQRIPLLRDLKKLVQVWIDRHAEQAQSKSKEQKDRYDSVGRLHELIEQEEKVLAELAGRLPVQSMLVEARAQERTLWARLPNPATKPKHRNTVSLALAAAPSPAVPAAAAAAAASPSSSSSSSGEGKREREPIPGVDYEIPDAPPGPILLDDFTGSFVTFHDDDAPGAGQEEEEEDDDEEDAPPPPPPPTFFDDLAEQPLPMPPPVATGSGSAGGGLVLADVATALPPEAQAILSMAPPPPPGALAAMTVGVAGLDEPLG